MIFSRILQSNMQTNQEKRENLKGRKKQREKSYSVFLEVVDGFLFIRLKGPIVQSIMYM